MSQSRRIAAYLLTGFTALLGPRADAATGGPDAFGYTWVDSDEPGVTAIAPDFTASDLRARGYQGDDTVLVVDLPVAAFPTGFPYYGVRYTRLWLSSNGWLAFVHPLDSFPTTTLMPNPASPNGQVAFLWDDWTLDGAVSLAMDGPNVDLDGYTFLIRVFAKGSPTLVIGQVYVTLWRTGCIKVVYVAAAPLVNARTQIGIENGSGTVGLAYMDSGVAQGGASFRDGYSVVFRPDGETCETSACSINVTPPALGSVLRAVRSMNDVEFTWPGAPTAEMSVHRLYRDGVPDVAAVIANRVADVATSIAGATDFAAIVLPPVAGFYQLVGVSCAGDLISPY